MKCPPSLVDLFLGVRFTYDAWIARTHETIVSSINHWARQEALHQCTHGIYYEHVLNNVGVIDDSFTEICFSSFFVKHSGGWAHGVVIVFLILSVLIFGKEHNEIASVAGKESKDR